jgi:suppressor of G2 allele of SKP1
MSVRHDWYQSDEKVVITVLLKNAAEKNYKCDINEDSLQITADNYELNLDLFATVVPEKSTHKATPHKIEINLIKRNFAKWMALEKKVEEVEIKVYSGKKPDEWDKLAKDIEKGEDKEEVI